MRHGQRVDMIGAQQMPGSAGGRNVLLTFTADRTAHRFRKDRSRVPAGRIVWNNYRIDVEQALNKKFGKGDWISFSLDGVLYFNPDPIRGKKLDMAKVQQVAADTIRAESYIARVYTKTQLTAGIPGNDPIDMRVRNGFNPARSWDIFTVTEPYFIFNATGTTHGSPYDYDTHVPVIFLGSARIKAGSYAETIGVGTSHPRRSSADPGS
jgi:hypothetical protein